MDQRFRWIEWIGLPIVAVFFGFAASTVRSYSQPTFQASSDLSVAELLGIDGKIKHRAAVESTKFGEKTHSWSQFVAWGKELYFKGTVKSPPMGPSPSAHLSPFYQCSHCHNHRKEDRNLVAQDPQARFWWIQESNKQITDSEPKLWLAPGTTLWGAVNRESFYNESYEVYHDLKTVDDRTMDPKKLEDAVQICCRYCSIGRFAEKWELQSLLAYLWELEVRLSDLNLPSEVEQALKSSLKKPDTNNTRAVAKSRDFLRRQILLKAGETTTAPPTKSDKSSVGPYPDKLIFEGDAIAGKELYSMACASCHGKGKPSEIEGSALVRDLKRFHKVLSIGTEQDDQPYMPRFTSQRLSRQQIADIQAYLTGDAK